MLNGVLTNIGTGKDLLYERAERPEIISINPDSKIANSIAFPLIVEGKGFTTASKVYWNGV